MIEANCLKWLEHELLSLEYKQSQLDPREQQEQGVTHYTWRTMEDDKVRPTHAVRDGEVYSWEYSDIYPGEEYGCRCIAEPTLKDTNVEQSQSAYTSEVLDPWGDIDFVSWFYYGGGTPVKLEDAGHLQDVIELSKAQIYPKVNAQIMAEAIKDSTTDFTYNFINSYDFGNVSYSLGKGVLSGDFKGTAEVQGDKIYINGTITYNYNDEFTDPASIREKILGSSSPENCPAWLDNVTDLDGKRYKITGSWESDVRGSATLINDK